MEVFVMKSLASFLIIVLMVSNVVPDKLSTESNNGRTLVSLVTESNTKDVSDPVMAGTQTESNPMNAETQTERVVTYTFTPNRPCYTQFFVNQQPPVGLRQANDANIRNICQPPRPQQTPQKTHYATMFDERYGIAVFSAYKLSPPDTNFSPIPEEDKFNWCKTPGIQRQGSQVAYRDQLHKIYQGSYLSAKYNRGHLVPAATLSSTTDKYLSTYTYTNAVPQQKDFNGLNWNKFEDAIRKYAKENCCKTGGTLYLLTGTSFTYNTEEIRKDSSKKDIKTLLLSKPVNENDIYIPKSLWTAGCCVDANGAKSFAGIGDNEDPGKYPNLMRRISVRELEEFLFADLKANGFDVTGLGVHLFPGNNQCSANNIYII